LIVAVTGATGFVGRYVVAELTRRGIETIASARTVPPAGAVGGRKMVPLDLGSPPADAFEALGRPDALIHLAWGGLPNYLSLHHFEDELPKQYRFLQSLVRAGLGTLVVTGTCFEYGASSGCLSEAQESRPTNPYGFAKNVLREQLEYLRRSVAFNLVWARLFYMHGDGQAPNSLWPQLKSAAERKDPSFSMSGGEQLRDYLPVTEVASHLVSLALARKDIGLVNVCSGKPVSVRNLVERWIADNGWSISPKLGVYPYPTYEPMAFWGDASKLQQALQPA
jgi:dTDP-6-deoxy-L-talose 4-dehydrogenase (NAD+)